MDILLQRCYATRLRKEDKRKRSAVRDSKRKHQRQLTMEEAMTVAGTTTSYVQISVEHCAWQINFERCHQQNSQVTPSTACPCPHFIVFGAVQLPVNGHRLGSHQKTLSDTEGDIATAALLSPHCDCCCCTHASTMRTFAGNFAVTMTPHSNREWSSLECVALWSHHRVRK